MMLFDGVDIGVLHEYRFISSSLHFGAEEEYPLEFTVEHGEDDSGPPNMPAEKLIHNAFVRRYDADAQFFVVSTGFQATPDEEALSIHMIGNLAFDPGIRDTMAGLLPQIEAEDPYRMTGTDPDMPAPGVVYDPDLPMALSDFVSMDASVFYVPASKLDLPWNFPLEFKFQWMLDEDTGRYSAEYFVRRAMDTRRFRIMIRTLTPAADPVDACIAAAEFDPAFRERVKAIFALRQSRNEMNRWIGGTPEARAKVRGLAGGPLTHGKGKRKKKRKR